jgi:alpha-beta hydrolase superfamily lysophospholipase
MFAGLPRRFGRYAPRVVLVLAMIGVMLWTGAVGCLWVNESRLVFRASRSRVVLPVAYPDLLQLTTSDGVGLDAVSLFAGSPSEYWILFCPPAAGTIHGRLQSQLQELQTLGYNVFAFDYRGFGRNRGYPSESGVYEDALAAYRYLTEERRVPASRVILAGRSLGSAVAVELSTRVTSAGLLLLSTLDSVPLTAGRFYPWAPVDWLASLRFDSMAKARRVRGPIVMVHGERDRLIPIAAARALFAELPEPKVMVETRGSHNRAGFGDGTPLGETLGRFWPASASGLRQDTPLAREHDDQSDSE